MVGTITLTWTSSYGATGPNTSRRLKGYTILQRVRRCLGWSLTCPIPIGIGRADISSFKGRTRYAVKKSG